MSDDKKLEKEQKQRSFLLRPSEKLDNFIASVVFIILLPLLPLFLEYLASDKGTVEDTSVILVTSFFTLSLGSSSKSKLFFSFSVLIGVTFAAYYPIVFLDKGHFKYMTDIAWIIIGLVVVLHMAERHLRHIEEESPFFNWWYGKEEIKKINDEIGGLMEEERATKKQINEQETNLESAKDEEEKVSINNKINRLKLEVRNIQSRIEKKEKIRSSIKTGSTENKKNNMTPKDKYMNI